jgi:hypothetical protein
MRWGELKTPGSAESANLRAQTVAIEASTRRAESAIWERFLAQRMTLRFAVRDSR